MISSHSSPNLQTERRFIRDAHVPASVRRLVRVGRAQGGGRLVGMRLAPKQMASLTEKGEGLLLRRYRITDDEGGHCHAVFTERPDV